MRRLDEFALTGSQLWVASIPFLGFGATRLTICGYWFSDLISFVVAPLWIAIAWRERRRLREHGVVVAVLFWCAATLFAALLHVTDNGLAELVRPLQMAVVLAGVAALDAERRMRLLRVFVVAGGAALIVATIGYTTDVLRLTNVGFYFQSPHPLADNLYRLTGTFQQSPQHYSEFLVALVATGLLIAQHSVGRWRGVAVTVAIVGVLHSFLTFSFGLVAMLIVLGTVVRARFRPPWFLACAVAVIALSWVMNVGLPSNEASGWLPCNQIDTGHKLIVHNPTNQSCRVILSDWPYSRARTPYGHAKRTALQLWSEAPWLGRGPGGYKQAAAHRFEAEYRHSGSFYSQPHNAYLGTLVASGIPGGLALLVLVVAVAKRRGTNPLFLAVVAFLLIGVNIDVMRQRHFWLLLACLPACPKIAIDPHKVGVIRAA